MVIRHLAFLAQRRLSLLFRLVIKVHVVLEPVLFAHVLLPTLTSDLDSFPLLPRSLAFRRIVAIWSFQAQIVRGLMFRFLRRNLNFKTQLSKHATQRTETGKFKKVQKQKT